MAELEPLSKELIERALRAKNLKFMVDSDGDYRADFTTDTPLGDFNGIFTIVGSRSHILRCWGFFDLEITAEHISQGIFLCNAYQIQHLYPGVYVNSRVDENGVRRGFFACQSASDCAHGIHLDGVQNAMSMLIGGAFAFAEWIVKQPQFWKSTQS